MRVHHVITRLIVGGAQENTLASVLGLRGIDDMEVRLFSGPTSGPEGSLETTAASVPGLLTIVPSLIRSPQPACDLRALIHLWRAFRSTRPDLVHTHSGKAGILGRLAARAAHVPLIVHTIHGPSFGPFQGPLPNLLFRSAEQWAGRCTSHFVVVADAMAQQYLAAGIGRPGSFTRVFSGFNLQPFLNARNDPDLRARLGLTPADFVIGKIARLAPLKGHDDLLRLAPDLIRARPETRFLLVGDGTDRERIEGAVRRSPELSRHFVFTGLVPPDAIPGLVGIMDVLVHLSRREGLARALPQALAAARPIIAYDLDGASEVCLHGTTGFLVPPGDLQALRHHLQTLAEDPATRERLGLEGRAWVLPRFPVERMVNGLAALYRRLQVEADASTTTQPAAPSL